MRGKACQLRHVGISHRITPAYAGKRVAVRSDLGTIRDHPRVCGEKMKSNPTTKKPKGSPPRVRGKDVLDALRRAENGITPAYAGKSRPRCRFSCCPGDYPRVCGEKLSTTSTDIHPAGSPPRVRGKVAVHVILGGAVWITPAYAGKSKSSRLVLD